MGLQTGTKFSREGLAELIAATLSLRTTLNVYVTTPPFDQLAEGALTDVVTTAAQMLDGTATDDVNFVSAMSSLRLVGDVVGGPFTARSLMLASLGDLLVSDSG